MNPKSVPVLVGQPFTITAWVIPVSCHLICNCLVTNGNGRGTPLAILAGQPVTCPHCQMTYTAGYDPAKGQIQIGMGRENTQETVQ